MIKKTALLLLTFAMLSFSESTPEESYSLTIKSTEFRNSEGVALFVLYNKNGSIPDEKYKHFYKKGISQIDKNGISTITFKDIPSGKYAINILHDENKNGKIDKKFLLPMPSEGIGFSNFESIGMSNRPNFSKASFLIKSNMEKVVKVIYL